MTTRASLYEFMQGAKDPERYKKRVPVNTVMNITGKLLKPEINFDLDFPQVNEEAQRQVDLVINNEQEMNKQVFSLLVLNKFLPPPNGIHNAEATGNGVMFAEANSTEFISHQLSLRPVHRGGSGHVVELVVAETGLGGFARQGFGQGVDEDP